MSTIKVTNIQHPSADEPAIELDPVDGVVFSAASFDASVITSGTLDESRLPGIDAAKITSGVLSSARLPTGLLVSDIVATGGVVSDDNGIRTHIFDATGTFTISSGSGLVEINVIGGGGSGANGFRTNAGGARHGSGGGGGAIFSADSTLSAGSYVVQVGGGGAANSGNGGTSLFVNQSTANGGGGFHGQGSDPNSPPRGSLGQGFGLVGVGPSGVGALLGTVQFIGAGRGGAGAAGNGINDTTGGPGRVILGTTYSSGGIRATNGPNQPPNTGNGGHGRDVTPLSNNQGGNGWNGGSGRVIIRYRIED